MGKKADIPFMKAYNFLLSRAGLTSAEKLVMIVVCRFWPNPYWASNQEVSKALGFTERYAEKIIKSLAEKRIIRRGYAHVSRNGRPHTVRVIMPCCFPKIPGHRIKWVKPEHMDGEQSEHTDGHCPNSSSFLPEQMDDLLDKSRRGKEITPEPLPIGRSQAPAEKRDLDQQANTRQLKSNNFRIHRRRLAPELTPAEHERRRQEQKRAVLAAGKNEVFSMTESR